MRYLFLSAPFVLLLVACSSEVQQVSDVQQVGNPDDPAITGFADDEMDAAIEKARASVDQFLAVFESGDGNVFSVKAPISDDNGTEHFWLTNITFADDEFSGTINNDPGIVKNVRNGQSWTVGKSEISDWMFFRDEKIHGNYTLRPLLKTMPADEAATYRSMLAEP